MDKIAFRAVSDLKKFAVLNGHSAKSYTPGCFLKYLSRRFKFSEFELKQAHQKGKIRIEMV